MLLVERAFAPDDTQHAYVKSSQSNNACINNKIHADVGVSDPTVSLCKISTNWHVLSMFCVCLT